MNYLLLYHGLGGNVKQSCLKGGRRGMKKVQKNAKLLCPVAPDGGKLRNSIKETGEINGNEINCKVYTNCDHAIYPEFRYRAKRKRKQYR